MQQIIIVHYGILGHVANPYYHDYFQLTFHPLSLFVFVCLSVSLSLSTGFVEAFQSEILRTLYDLTVSLKSVMDKSYDEETKPRYLRLCERLKLTSKVSYNT